MTSKQEAKMSMYDAVLKHCNTNPAIVATIPAFQTAAAALASVYSSLVATAQMEMNEISGVAIDKSVAKINLAQQGADISGAIFAFAAAANNNELKEQARNPVSKLIKLKDELLAPACQNIHDIANTNIAALATYGITAAILTSFQAAIDEYADVIPSPRNAVSARASHAATIKLLFKQADKIVKDQMDKIVLQFKTPNQSFYNAFKNNRVIVDAAVSPTQVIGIVTGSIDKKPIPGAEITFLGLPISSNAGIDGAYTAKNPNSGIHSMRFKADGFEELIVPNIELKLGQATTLNVELVPSP